MLTARDYLNSPDGSAYGVKQKMGQFNLMGKLPLHNLYRRRAERAAARDHRRDDVLAYHRPVGGRARNSTANC